MPDDQHMQAMRQAMTNLENALSDDQPEPEAVAWCVNEVYLAAEQMLHAIEQEYDDDEPELRMGSAGPETL